MLVAALVSPVTADAMVVGVVNLSFFIGEKGWLAARWWLVAAWWLLSGSPTRVEGMSVRLVPLRGAVVIVGVALSIACTVLVLETRATPTRLESVGLSV